MPPKVFGTDSPRFAKRSRACLRVRPVKFGIDVSRTVPKRERAGIGKYADMLVQGLARVDTAHEFILYPGLGDFVHPQYGVSCDISVPARPNFRKYTGSLPAFADGHPQAEQDAVDVVHATAFSCPDVRPARLVVTVYDLTYRLFPAFHLPSNIEFCERNMTHAVERGDYFIAISEQTRKDFITTYGVSRERVEVIYPAAEYMFVPVTDRERLARTLDKHDIRDDYILFVGATEPRKNIVSLLKAFAALSADEESSKYLLVVVGTQGWLNDEVYGLPASLGIASRVKFLGYVDDEDLPVLYSAARLFVYPSLYEGFGLPVLEAMSCAAPVITSRVSSLPEVTGDAAILIDPRDVGELTRAMKTVLEDDEITANLRKRSLKRAELFSLERLARETLRVYEAVVGSSADVPRSGGIERGGAVARMDRRLRGLLRVVSSVFR